MPLNARIDVSDCLIDYLGSGKVWKVYRAKVNGEPRVVKRAMMLSENSVDENFQHFKMLEGTGIATLSFLEIGRIGQESVLIGEDLNVDDSLIYVSPNSIPVRSTGEYDDLNDFVSAFIERENERFIIDAHQAEKFRYENPLIEISNFGQFCEKMMEVAEIAGRHGLHLWRDCYFFGTKKYANVSRLTYRVADFDHIFTGEQKADELERNNQYEVLLSLRQFICSFVETSKAKPYLADIDRLLNA